MNTNLKNDSEAKSPWLPGLPRYRPRDCHYIFAMEGAYVVINYALERSGHQVSRSRGRRSSSSTKRVKRIKVYDADVADTNAVRRMLHHTADQHGNLDILSEQCRRHARCGLFGIGEGVGSGSWHQPPRAVFCHAGSSQHYDREENAWTH